MSATDTDREIRDSSVYWFAILEAARQRGDYATATKADTELRRLGVQVRHRRRLRAQGVSHA